MDNIVPLRPALELTFVESSKGWLLACGNEFSVNLMGDNWTVDLDTNLPYTLKLGGEEEGNDYYISITIIRHKVVSVTKTTPMISFTAVPLKQFTVPSDHALANCFHVIREMT